ncbi:DUF4384 domain-containing protein [Myxococcota bacterium]|nr:DUF4384 domain-containing protein [Myxococcota bacterium]
MNRYPTGPQEEAFEQLLQAFFEEEKKDADPPSLDLLARIQSRDSFTAHTQYPLDGFETPPDTSDRRLSTPTQSAPPLSTTTRTSAPPLSTPTRTGDAPVGRSIGSLRRWLRWGGLSFAMVSLCFVFLFRPQKIHLQEKPLGDIPTSLPHETELLSRGSHRPHLLIFVQRARKTRLARSGELFVQGDRLQLVLNSPVDSFGYIVHRDAKGQITPLYPNAQTKPSFPLKASKQFPLSGSLEVIDSADGDEEIWACFSKHALSFSQAKETLLATLARPLASHTSKTPPQHCYTVQAFRLHRPKEQR